MTKFEIGDKVLATEQAITESYEENHLLKNVIYEVVAHKGTYKTFVQIARHRSQNSLTVVTSDLIKLNRWDNSDVVSKGKLVYNETQQPETKPGKYWNQELMGRVLETLSENMKKEIPGSEITRLWRESAYGKG